MTTPFHPLDVEAAAKAIYIADISPDRPKAWEQLHDGIHADKTLKIVYLVLARAALTAFLSSAKARGAAREGFGHWSEKGTIMLNSDKFSASEIPLVIIRMEE